MSFDKFQELRRSQFILTYGPGSIIETKYGPRLIPALRHGIPYFTTVARENEINDVRLANLINNKYDNKYDVRLFKLPSNNSKYSKNKGYKTYIFPVWKICYNHEIPILFDSSHSKSNGYCPECHQSENDKNNKIGSVRFVKACVEGHIDDVDWDKAVHGNNGCGSYYFEWNVKDSSLSGINIKCPICGTENNLENIIRNNYIKCTGKYLENSSPLEGEVSFMGNVKEYNCSQSMKIVQRQSTSLRFPNTFTILTIPPYDDNFSRLVQTRDIKLFLKTLMELDSEKQKEVLLEILFDKYDNEKILKNKYDENKNEFFKVVKTLLNENVTLTDIIAEEFETLKINKSRCTDNFIKRRVNSGKYFKLDLNSYSFPLKVFSIDKIKTVTAQYGYQRNPKPNKNKETGEIIESNNVSVGYFENSDEQCIWYPAFEGIGEGIFISSDLNPFVISDNYDIFNEWEINCPTHNIMQNVGLNVKNPLFVWWHTLSHAIIKSLSYISGYSSSSIRERVYYNDKGEGGILLYTTSAGEDCGMGGLIEATENFDKILNQASNTIINCSNDPLCEEQHITKNRVNGAACINCLFLSETSCGYSNMWLDRHLLLGD